MTSFHVPFVLALLLLIVCLLLAAGCAGVSQSVTRTENGSIADDGKGLPVKLTPAIPHGKYIFFEHFRVESGVPLSDNCEGTVGGSIDFPFYYFDEKNGVLSTLDTSGMPLNESLIMYFGDGIALKGTAGMGASTHTSPVYSLPYTQKSVWTEKNVTIESVSEDGTVTFLFDQDPISIKPKQRWANITREIRVIEWRGNHGNCTAEFNTTESFYNAGILDKSTIVFR
jgi:hypothetical protein